MGPGSTAPAEQSAEHAATLHSYHIYHPVILCRCMGQWSDIWLRCAGIYRRARHGRSSTLRGPQAAQYVRVLRAWGRAAAFAEQSAAQTALLRGLPAYGLLFRASRSQRATLRAQWAHPSIPACRYAMKAFDTSQSLGQDPKSRLSCMLRLPITDSINRSSHAAWCRDSPQINDEIHVIGHSKGKLLCSNNTRYRTALSKACCMCAGCPVAVGNLWDVTDRDIDRFAMAVLEKWLFEEKSNGDLQDAAATERESNMVIQGIKRRLCISRSISDSRSVCRLPHLIGAAPVCYGVPTSVLLQ